MQDLVLIGLFLGLVGWYVSTIEDLKQRVKNLEVKRNERSNGKIKKT
jgi:hypothetical protein